MLGYMTSLKQLNDKLTFDLRSTQEQLDHLQQQDLAQSTKLLRTECETLRLNSLTQTQNLSQFQ